MSDLNPNPMEDDQASVSSSAGKTQDVAETANRLPEARVPLSLGDVSSRFDLAKRLLSARVGTPEDNDSNKQIINAAKGGPCK